MQYQLSTTRRRRRLVAAIVVASTALLTLVACSSGRTDTSSGEQHKTAAGGLLNTDSCQNYQSAPGVTDTQIKLGATTPLTGPLAHPEIAKAEQAYFDYASKELGGVKGKSIVLDVKDDAYNPSRAQQNVRDFTNSGDIFAMAGSFGTATTLGYWTTTNQQCLPNLFVQSGASELGDPQGHAWTLPFLPPYAGESIAYAKHMTGDTKVKTVAVLAQSDDLGNAYTSALTKALAGSDVKVVKTETFGVSDPTVQTQMGVLAATKADALLIAGLGPQVPQAINNAAKLGWNPLMLVAGPAAVTGRVQVAKPTPDQKILTTGYLMDPKDPEWASNPAMQTYKTGMAKYAPDVDASLYNSGLGWTIGAATYATLNRAASLTRIDVMASARTLSGVNPGLVLPGLSINLKPTDPFAILGLQVEQFNSATNLFQLIKGDTVLSNGQTSITNISAEISQYLK